MQLTNILYTNNVLFKKVLLCINENLTLNVVSIQQVTAPLKILNKNFHNKEVFSVISVILSP